jgi:hypothetical protein
VYNGNMIDPLDLDGILEHLRFQVRADNTRITAHAQQEMIEEAIGLDDVYAAVETGQILENYPEHRRGACCLLCGSARNGRPIHVVCTTVNPLLIVITAYRPKPPKWATPTRRMVS